MHPVPRTVANAVLDRGHRLVCEHVSCVDCDADEHAVEDLGRLGAAGESRTMVAESLPRQNRHWPCLLGSIGCLCSFFLDPVGLSLSAVRVKVKILGLMAT